MKFSELFLLAVGLSMDTFAVGICIGLTIKRAVTGKALIAGLYFGIFQAVMPVIGYMVARLFADKIIAYDHWIAFALLCFLGGKMIVGSLRGEEDDVVDEEASLKLQKMLPLAVATSIDALAVGVSFAFLQVDIVPAVSFIGGVTFVLSAIGVKIGNVFGAKFKSRAGIAGGIILILIGSKILLEHYNIFVL